MSSLKIEKFIAGTHEKTIKVPFFIFQITVRLLPKAAFAALAEKGLHLDEIRTAKKNGAPYSSTIDVTEHGIDKRVVISLQA